MMERFINIIHDAASNMEEYERLKLKIPSLRSAYKYVTNWFAKGVGCSGFYSVRLKFVLCRIAAITKYLSSHLSLFAVQDVWQHYLIDCAAGAKGACRLRENVV